MYIRADAVGDEVRVPYIAVGVVRERRKRWEREQAEGSSQHQNRRQLQRSPPPGGRWCCRQHEPGTEDGDKGEAKLRPEVADRLGANSGGAVQHQRVQRESHDTQPKQGAHAKKRHLRRVPPWETTFDEEAGARTAHCPRPALRLAVCLYALLSET